MTHHSYHSETATLNRFIFACCEQRVEVFQYQIKALEDAEWDALPILRKQSDRLQALLDDMLQASTPPSHASRQATPMAGSGPFPRPRAGGDLRSLSGSIEIMANNLVHLLPLITPKKHKSF